jgi:hypothetical protein
MLTLVFGTPPKALTFNPSQRGFALVNWVENDFKMDFQVAEGK